MNILTATRILENNEFKIIKDDNYKRALLKEQKRNNRLKRKQDFSVLRESNNKKAKLVDCADDVIDTLNNLDTPKARIKDYNYQGTNFVVCQVNDLMKRFGVTGNEITVSYSTIKEKHYGKGIKKGDVSHIYTADFLKQVCTQLPNPVIISQYITAKAQDKNIITFYLNLKMNGRWALVGIDINPNDSKVTTIFGDDLKTKSGNDKIIKYVQYVNFDDHSETKELIDMIDLDTVNEDLFD